MKRKIITILLGLIILIVGLALFSINIFAETPADCGSGTDVSPKHCCTCLDLVASPATIWRGESSTLILYLDNDRNAPSSSCTGDGYDVNDGTAVCSINNGVLSPTTYNDGTYNYTVWPGDGPVTITYTATCSGIGGTKSDTATVTVNNRAPNVPTLLAPPDNVWITSEPTFQASATDPEGDQIKLCFDLDSNDSCDNNWTGLANSGSTFSWSTSVPDTTGRSWRAKAQDEYGAESGWTSRTLKKDTTRPWAQISYPTGTFTEISFTVTLDEGDYDISGIAEGDVDVNIKPWGGSWSGWVNTGLPNGGSTITTFDYTGNWHYTYKFRYRVKDNAGWWSDPWVEGGEIFLNRVPNVPELKAPEDDKWINYEPTFIANVSDPDGAPFGDTVQAGFDLDSNGSYENWTGLASSGSDVSWSTTVPDVTSRPWRARARDNYGSLSGWSGSWTLKKDTINPTASIDQENGISLDTSIWVNLTEFDERSGLAEGDVDVRINGGSWVNTDLPNGGNTFDNFTYTGVRGSTYEFRYRVRDNAGNWSSPWATDGSVYINQIPQILNTWWEPFNICLADSREVILYWEYFDPEGQSQYSFQIQVYDQGGALIRDTVERVSGSDFYVPTRDPNFPPVPNPDLLNWNATYDWQVRVKDEAAGGPGNWSEWAYDTFTTPLHQYPFPVIFDWTPEYPNAYDLDYPNQPDVNVTFYDQSTCYDINNNPTDCAGWTWTFTDGDPATSPGLNPITKFLFEGDKDIILIVCDADNYCCSDEKSIYVNFPLPEWRERIPR